MYLGLFSCQLGQIAIDDLESPNFLVQHPIVVPAKSDSDVMFCLQSYQGLIIDKSPVYLSYPQDRINTQVIYWFALARVECTNLCFA